MTELDQEDIHIISRQSNWSRQDIDKLLKDNIYTSKQDWGKFIQLTLASLGIGFLVSGVIFFFAYNWADLHKFAKIGLLEALVIIACVGAVRVKNNAVLRNSLLMGTSMLVGALFAVFGQIYQTGANAYDFFLGWAMSITIWAAISDFAPIWLLYLVLLNTTLGCYADQVAQHWSGELMFTLLFLLNVTALFITGFIAKNSKEIVIPGWFSNTVSLAAVGFATVGICGGILDNASAELAILFLIAGAFYFYAIWNALNTKKLFYMAVIPFSVIIIVSALLIKAMDDLGMFFVISLFIIGSVTLVIKNLLNLQRKWANVES